MHSRFSEKWLETLCSTLPGVHSAVFLVPDSAKKQLHLLARWPGDLAQPNDFFATAKLVLKKRGEVCLSKAHQIDGQDFDYFAKPVFIRSRFAGVLAVKLKHLPSSQHLALFRMLKVGVKWLCLASFREPEQDGFYREVVEVMAACFDQQGYRRGLIRLAAELTSRLDCRHVAIGELEGHHSRVVALSNSGHFDQRSMRLQALADVMDEAVEQQRIILCPDDGGPPDQSAHQQFVSEFDTPSIATIPMLDQGRTQGAVVLLGGENRPLDLEIVEQCRQILSLVTPFLILKRDQEKNIWSRFVANRRSGQVKARRPSAPKFQDAMVYADIKAQQVALLNRVSALHHRRRPVLIGTVSAEVSRRVSGWLRDHGLSHRVLKDRQDHEQASVIAELEKPGAITVAMNLTGPGTNLAPGRTVNEVDGLHVISLSLNPAVRLDHQVFSDDAQRGENGGGETLLSLEDPLLKHIFTPSILRLFRFIAGGREQIDGNLCRLLFRVAQSRYDKGRGRSLNRLANPDQSRCRTPAFEAG